MKKLSVKIIIIICFVKNSGSVYSQVGYDNPNPDPISIPPSPTAASLGKFGDIPVNFFNGLADISIPICELQCKGYSIPISLSYHASGVRVEEIAGWVGLGWALNAGGLITRTVIGKPDEGGNGFLTNAYMLLNSAIYSSSGFEQNVGRGVYDMLPDKFIYNFNGNTGKFIFNESGNPVPMPYEDIKISRILPGLSGWDILSQDGTHYIFDSDGIEETESSNSCNEDGDDYISSWYLTGIVFPNGEHVDFVYSTQYSVARENTNSEHSNFSAPQSHCPLVGHVTCTTNTIIHQRRLLAIETNTEKVEFESSNGREDIFDDYKLDKIIVRNKNNQTKKEFKLDFSYFQTSTNNPLYKRLKLESVTERSCDNSEKPPHRFEYDDSKILPPRNSKSIDHWGFFNGASNTTTLIPSSNDEWGIFLGADRETHPSFLYAGTLNKITYPTGGSTEFEYEPNSYSLTKAGAVNELAVTSDEVLCHAAYTSQPSCTTTIHIDIPQTVRVHYYCNNNNHVEYGSMVLLKNQTGQNLVDQGGFAVGYNDLYITQGDYDLIAITDIPGDVCHIGFDYTLYDNTTTQPIINKLVGGLRIKKIISKESDVSQNNLVKEYFYTLTSDPDRSSGVLYDSLDYRQVSSNSNNCVTISRSSLSTMPLGSNSGSAVGYREVIEKAGQNTDVGYTKYEYYYDTYNSGVFPSKMYLSDWKRGILHIKSTFDKSNLLKERKIINYELNNVSDNYITIKAAFGKTVKNCPYNSPCEACGGPGSVLCSFSDIYRYLVRIFSIHSQWLYKSSEIREIYEQSSSNPLITYKYFSYDNSQHANVTRTEEINSDGTTHSTLLKYPQDYSEPTGTTLDEASNALFQMINDKHIHNKVIEETRTITAGQSEEIISSSFSTFKVLSNGLIKPTKTSSLSLSEPVSMNWYNSNRPHIDNSGNNSTFEFSNEYKTDLIFDKYDGIGNLIQYHKEDLKSISLEWDNDGLNPIAQFTGASYNDTTLGNECSFNGFESSGTSDDDWSMSSASIETSNPHTGNACALIPTNAPYGPRKDFKPDDQNQKFRFSCWIKTESSFSNGEGNLIIHSMHDNTTVTVFPPTNSISGSYVAVPITNTNGQWKYFEANFDLKSMHDYLISNAIDEPLRLRSYVTNTDDNSNVWIDDMRMEPIHTEVQTITYHPVFSQLPSSISDSRSIPMYYEYDSFGRLFTIRNQEKNILKKIDYNFKH